MKVIGAVSERGCELPVNQTQLADTVGLSLVHVNKSLRQLRESGGVAFRKGRLIIEDVERLEEICGFKSNYLHLTNIAERSPPSTFDDALATAES